MTSCTDLGTSRVAGDLLCRANSDEASVRRGTFLKSMLATCTVGRDGGAKLPDRFNPKVLPADSLELDTQHLGSVLKKLPFCFKCNVPKLFPLF